MGAKLFVENLENFQNGTISAEKQDDSLSCYAPMLSKKDGLIDFTKEAKEIEWAIRGLSPWPGAYTYSDGEIFKIWEADVKDGDGKEPGKVLNISKDGIEIGTGNGVLIAKVIQVPGKKRMNVSDYIKGHKIEIGKILG